MSLPADERHVPRPAPHDGAAGDGGIVSAPRAPLQPRPAEGIDGILAAQELAGVGVVLQDGSLALSNRRFIDLLGPAPGDGVPRAIAVHACDISHAGQPASLAFVFDVAGARPGWSRADRALRLLGDVNAAVVRAEREADLLHELCRVLVERGGYACVWIAHPEHDAAIPVRVAAAGDDAVLARAPIGWADPARGGGLVARALGTGRLQIGGDGAPGGDVAPWPDSGASTGGGAIAALPLTHAGVTFGAVVLVASGAGTFDAEEVGLLDQLAAGAAHGIGALRLRAGHERLSERLRRSMNEIVGALTTVLESRDPYTASHHRRVSGLAVCIARVMGLPQGEIDGIALAASVHDIGKLFVPIELLAKPGRLSEPELRLMQEHAKAGYDILKGIEFPWPVAEMVLQHHERLDGSGYPYGSTDGLIVLGAKIIAVADVFESMTTYRPYRPALGVEAALGELRRGRGTLYHGPAVDACVAVAMDWDNDEGRAGAGGGP